MSEFASQADATAALQAALNTDSVSQAATTTPHTAPATPAVDAPEGATPAPAEDTFTSFDPSSLTDPQLQAAYRQMQADYTRKTQEVAEYRRFADEIGGIESARQAVTFATRLNSDPTFALDVHARLTQALTAHGLTPAQAAAEATAQIGDASTGGEEYGDEGYGELPPHIQAQLAQVDELTQWRAQVEEERLQTHLANELQRQEMAIRHANPNYGDDDFEAIYNLSYATGGDLVAAQRQYQSLNDRLMQQWINAKATVPTAAPPMNTGAAQTPRKWASLDEADKAAQEHLRNFLASQG